MQAMHNIFSCKTFEWRTMSGKTASRGKRPRVFRVDVVHDMFQGQAQRTVHVYSAMKVDGCHTFSYSERSGRFGNALPEGATEAEKRAFALYEQLKYVEGVDEIRPLSHAVEIRFGRVHDADAIMPEVLTLIFMHLGYKHVQLSFWQETLGRNELARIEAPYNLRVDGVTIDVRPADAPPSMGGLYLQLQVGRATYSVPVQGALDSELTDYITRTDQQVVVVAVGRT
jgi:hypothetical protein